MLIINGSPKGKRSDTLRIALAFAEGAGAQYEIIDTMKINVAPCLGCFACWRKTPGICAQKDDMQELLGKIAQADTVLWSMPLYYFSMPSNVKKIIDRMLPLVSGKQYTDENGQTYHPLRSPMQTRHILIAGSGFPDMDGNFDTLVALFDRIFGKSSPKILCCESPLLNISEVAEVVEKYLSLVRRAGSEYAECGQISDETMALLNEKMIDPDVYRAACTSTF